MNLRKSTPEDVRWLYRLLLEREPESDQHVLDLVRSGALVNELVHMVLASKEYINRQADIKKLMSNA